MLFVALIAGAAAGVIDTAFGTATPVVTTTATPVAASAPANHVLLTTQVPADLIPLFTGAAASSSCHLPPELLAAQSKVESGYQRDALSTAGAVGIMQFLPATWATEGIDADHDGQAVITDPADAIYSAAKLDCENLDRIKQSGIGGDTTGLMLAAYNAGLGTVLDCHCLPAIQQTRDYVATIERLAPTLAVTPMPTVSPATSRPVHMTYPLATHAVVTQTYGPNADGSFHPGLDLAAPAGTSILAATSGTVTYAAPEAGYGNYICIAATPTLATCYAHLAVIAVHTGQTVGAGQPIGTEGATGDATGPHLHFEVRISGQTVDPVGYLPAA